MEDSRLDAQSVLAAEAATEEFDAPSTLTLKSGVVLNLKPVPPLLLRRAMTGIDPPKVPMVFDADRGREIENPNDPDYLHALEAVATAQENAVLGVLILRGTAPSSIPDGFPKPEDESWQEELAVLADFNPALGSIPLATAPQRYLAWIQYVVLTDIEDLVLIGASVARLSGVRELDVGTAMHSFRSLLAGRIDSADGVPTSTSNGHSVPATAGGSST